MQPPKLGGCIVPSCRRVCRNKAHHRSQMSSSMGRRPLMWLVVCAELISATVTPSHRDTPIQDSISQVDLLLLPCQSLQLVKPLQLVLSRNLLSFARMRMPLHALQLLACGSNRHGQLGVGDRFDRDIPWPLAFGPYSATVIYVHQRAS